MIPARDAPSNRFQVNLSNSAGVWSAAQGKTMKQAFMRALKAFDPATIQHSTGLMPRFITLYEGCHGRVGKDLGCHRFHMEDGRAQVTIIRLVRQ